jgi:GTP diphosphokinase / guanosine-3',5'-bis(diphosphate) 3'-diphosphatase
MRCSKRQSWNATVYQNLNFDFTRDVAPVTWANNRIKDPDLVIAALLHDAIEDCEVPKELIAESFGKDLATLVAEVTDDKTLPKQERKNAQISNAASKSVQAKILKLADKTSNLRAVAMSPTANWSAKRRIEYVNWAQAMAKGLRGVNKWLEHEFNEAAARAERSIRPAI